LTDTQIDPGFLGRTLLKHPLLSYFSMAYAIKYIFVVPLTLSTWGFYSGDWQAFFVLSTYGPFIGGVVMAYLIDGRAGVGRLLRRVKQWRLGWPWLLFIFAGVPGLFLLAVAVVPGNLAGYGLQGQSAVALVVSYIVTYVVTWFLGGPLGEEVGWRGFALPRMLTRYGPLWGTLLLGIVHCFWHFEEFFTSNQGGGPGTGWTPFVVNLPLFLLLTVSFNITMTWMFNRTRGSLFAAISYHASWDAPQGALLPLFPVVGVTSLYLGMNAVFGGFALLLIMLTRGRLAYNPCRNAALLQQPLGKSPPQVPTFPLLELSQ
jgi:membrane protease YdiL (CAAX protease family)